MSKKKILGMIGDLDNIKNDIQRNGKNKLGKVGNVDDT
jgi:hypothetical protein